MKEARTRTRNELLPGTLEMLILKTLSIESTHGYGIAQHIQMLSADVLTIEEGSLYPALQKLLLKGWVKASPAISDTGRAVREYSGFRGCAKGTVDDHTQRARAWNVADRQKGIVDADRAGADEDGVVASAHLVGEAQGVGAADPLRLPRRGRHAPVERLGVGDGDGRPCQELFADQRIIAPHLS